MKKKNFFSRLFFLFSLFFAIALLLGYSAPYVSPETFWPIAFFGLAVPYLIVANLFFLVLYAIKGSNKFFFTLIVLGLGYKSIPTLVQFNFQKGENLEKEAKIKVLSFNVRVFDLYMWSKEKKTRNKIFEFLQREDPDILCMQEFYQRDVQDPNYEFKTLDTLIQLLSAKNYHVDYTITLRDNDNWGLITMSKYPIINKGSVNFNDNSDNSCIFTDLLYGEDTIRVYNAHLASIKLDKHDYKAIQGVNQNEYSENLDQEKLIFKKLKQSFQRRASQADSIKASLYKSPYPTLFCGDFNDPPTSYSYQTVKSKMKDAFMQSGKGFGQTYIGDFPSFRIDFIFHDQLFQSRNFTTHPEELSDHHPISAEVYLKKN